MIATNSSSIKLNEDINSFVGEDQTELIEKLLSIGTALSSSNNLQDLLTLILAKSREITYSDAGSVYLINRQESEPKLYFKVAQNDSLPNLRVEEFSTPLTLKSLAGYVAITGESLNIPDAYNLSADLPYRLESRFDKDFHYRTRSVLVLPMQDQEGEIIGVLQLINRKTQSDLIVTNENVLEVTQAYSEWEERVLRSLASQAAISIERNQLQDSIENLFEGFVTASIQLIEMRDTTTSGHSERVADLTVRLAEETHRVNTGALRLIEFRDREIKEIRYASLLHDFGKVCVPEIILNKRNKLYPEQLELLRQRFSLAQRTLEMECAQKKYQYLLEHSHHRDSDNEFCPHCQQVELFEQETQQFQELLHNFLLLIEKLNKPEVILTKKFEAFSEEAFTSLTKLAQYNYRDYDGQIKPLINPEEIEQLLVPRGNLTVQERQQIESHVTWTYQFLKGIPWTKALKNVPIIAYGHHEKLDGTGYPLKLKEAEIPIQSQMMAIADIYDALTASDRPYKKSLSIEIALKILREEGTKGRLNPELVTLFEQRQVFKVLGHSYDL